MTLDDFAAAGVQLADERGLDAVTLALVAERVELTTTGLYRYVDSKDTLLEVVVDAALGDPPIPAADCPAGATGHARGSRPSGSDATRTRGWRRCGPSKHLDARAPSDGSTA